MTMHPPRAEQRPHRFENHGKLREDPYYWLCDRDDPATLAYLKEENAYAYAKMAHARPLQERLYKELIARIEEDDQSAAYKDGDYLYYSRTAKGKNYRIYCRRKGNMDAPEEVYLDANALAEKHPYFDMAYLEVSPDGNWLAYAIDVQGDEAFDLHFRDLRTGTDAHEVIPDVSDDGEWSQDGTHFYYTRDDETRRPYQILRHCFGSDPDSDSIVYDEPDEKFHVGLYASQDRRFLFAFSLSKETSEVHGLPSSRTEASFRPILRRCEGIRYFVEHHEGSFLIRTNDNAKDFRLLRIPADDTDLHRAEEIIPHRKGIHLEDILCLRHHLVVFEREQGQERIRAVDWRDQSEQVIRMPDAVYTLSEGNNAEYGTSSFQFLHASPIRPTSVYQHDLETGNRHCLKTSKVSSGHCPDNYVVERRYARSHDGAEVPITLCYRRDTLLDGSAPAWIYGYGAYGEALPPSFSRANLSFLERGFVVATAHVRGGGFLGEAWYEDGKFLRKRNSFHDFIACAEFLIDKGYTCPERLTAEGASAGGMLIGAVLNERPDLFRAAVAGVPFVDVTSTMLDSSIPLTTHEYEEWGNPNDKTYFDYILSYSPYDNVRKQRYPALLVTAGLNDPRVQYWEPAKWVARLRSNHQGDEPILLKTNLEAGHGGASGRYEIYREIAFEQAFLLDQLGFTN